MLFLIVILPLLLLSLYPLISLVAETAQLVSCSLAHPAHLCGLILRTEQLEPGTRDCRWFATIFLLVRLLHFVIAAMTLGVMFNVFSTIILVVVVHHAH